LHIESTLPIGLVLPLVALAIFVAWMLYFRKQENSVLPGPVRILLAIARVLIFLVTGLLIISPWLRTTVDKQNKPFYIIARDNSISIPGAADKNAVIRQQSILGEQLVNSLEARFQVQEVLFGSRTAEGNSAAYTDPETDPGELFSYLRIFARTHDLGGVLILTDGVATRGPSFSSAARNFPHPVTVLASGDSTRFPDVRIQDVISNEWVRKNSTFPVRVYFNTGDYAGAGFKVQVTGPAGLIEEKVFRTAAQDAPFADFLIQAPNSGTLSLTARIIPDQPDKNQDNDWKRFTVKVIEQEGEVLFLYEAPHPDINAIVQALRGTNSLNVNVLPVAEFKGSDQEHDLIILHGLPSQKHPIAELMKKAAESQIPVLFIIGRTTDPILFNRMNHGMVIDNRRKSGEAAQGTLNPDFSQFSLPGDFADHLNNWPPLELSFEVYSPDPGSRILMSQKIMNIDLPDPLVVFTNTAGVKYGFFCGEGIWMWRMHEFREQKNHDYFDDFLSRTIQYLILDEEKDRFRVTLPDELFAFSPVRINAHLLNNSLEAVNEPDVLFTVTDSSGQTTEYRMGRINDYYELTINGFVPGTYRYSAETRLGTENFQRTGEMTMLVRPLEQLAPVADFASLRLMAANTNGRFFGPGQEDALLSSLSSFEPSEIRIRTEYKWYDLINFKSLLAVLIFLLAMEWFLRRWFGIR
jgi:hypothetical protein